MSRIIHYTSATIFLSIVKNRMLWASDPKFLNDYDEIEYGKNLFIQEIEKIKNVVKESSFIPEHAALIIDFLVWQSVGVCSFSKEPDLLSQWRGYCPVNGGYAIEFERDLMFNSNSDIQFVDCIYDFEKQQRFKEEYAVSLRSLSKKSTFNTVEEFYPVIHDMFSKICCFKNDGFFEEKEIRMIVPPKNRELNFREKNGLFVPYYEVEFNIDAIKTIWIGPMPDSNLAKKSIELLLDALLNSDQHPLTEKPRVAVSKVSLRS